MSRNAYSFRSRGGSEPPEKKQRVLGPNTSDASRVVYLGNVPKDWNERIVRSVVAGSGHIVDIRVRIDPSGRSKNFVFVEYSDPQQALRGVELLSQVTLGPNRKFRVELSKEGLRTQYKDRPPLQLQRDDLPFYVNLPSAMISEGPPLPSQYQEQQQHQQHQQQQQLLLQPLQQQQQQYDGMNGANSVAPLVSQPTAEIPIPDVLSSASQMLPNYNADAFTMEDKISQNLQGLSPPQLIELIATLKKFIGINPAIAQQAFSVSPNIPIAAAQALLLMGLIDPNVITTALQLAAPSNASVMIPPVSSATSTPSMGVSVLNSHTQPDPRWPTLPGYVGSKLAQLPASEAATIAQILQLTPNVIAGLPQEQKQLIENIRRQYL